MFLTFFYALRQNGIPVSLHEYLSLMEGLRRGLAAFSIDQFYALAKAVFVKHEGQLDRFDLLFGRFF